MAYPAEMRICQALVVFERFTDQSRQVLVVAQEEARLFQHPWIGTEHILLGLIQGRGIAGQVLTEMGVSLTGVRGHVEEIVPSSGAPAQGSPPFTPRAKKVLELALRDALRLGAGYIGTEHLLLGLISEGEGAGAHVLLSLDIKLSDVRQRVISQLSGIQREESSEGQELGGVARRVAPTEAVVVICSFCGLHPPESGELVAGSNAFICENCISHWSLRIGRSRSVRHTWISESHSNVVTPGEPPADTERARAEIGAAFANHGSLSEDGKSALEVEKGANLGWAVTAARENRPAFVEAEVVVSVDEIIFVDPEHAAVWYSIFVNGSPVLTRRRGDAVLVDSEWKMARSTFCQIMAMAGVTCPPE